MYHRYLIYDVKLTTKIDGMGPFNPSGIPCCFWVQSYSPVGPIYVGLYITKVVMNLEGDLLIIGYSKFVNILKS